ncbi:hypothetical protein PFFCH_05491 [Plasmodium falciparum FCH/4]|uniref:Uncharacterized protein n=1 Tax=Plasmodium falciparum FCH/4 TaxID=1036724 RepID=A0A024VFW0_PLAFA|nr:hypothetical protein PFFCH_05491 [Plasmodium falciparum FCH/4]
MKIETQMLYFLCEDNKFSVDCSYKHIALLSIILYNLEYIDLLHTP